MLGTFTGDSSGILNYGKIKEIRKYKRKNCMETPVLRGNGEEEYLRFELDEILPVEPIKTVQQGAEIANYTTMYLLMNAETTQELYFRSRLEIELYKILKVISQAKGVKIVRRRGFFLVGNIKVEILNSKKVRIEDEITLWDAIEEKIYYYLEIRNDVGVV